MKLKTKTEFRLLAFVTGFLAIFFLGTAMVMFHIYGKFQSIPWDKVFLNKYVHDELMAAFRSAAYAVIGLAVFQGVLSGMLFKQVKKLPDE
jgi:hypothetical protein